MIMMAMMTIMTNMRVMIVSTDTIEKYGHSISLWFWPLFCPLLHFPCVLPLNFTLALALYFAIICALVFRAKRIANKRARARAKHMGNEEESNNFAKMQGKN